jgi:glucose uptake protein GlcU
MGVFYLLLTAVGESGGYLFDRLNFKNTRIRMRTLMLLTFLTMSMFLVAYILFVKQSTPTFTPVSVAIILLVVSFSFFGNIFDSLSLKFDDLSLREPLVDFAPILAGLIGYGLYPSERNTKTLGAFIAGTLVVYWGLHRVKLGKLQSRGIRFLLLASGFYAILPSLYKESLSYFSPAYISVFRVVGILILSTIFLRPKAFIKEVTYTRAYYGLLTGAFCSAAAIAGIYAIQVYGVVLTMLFLMLGPAIRYLTGQFILHEKVRRVEIVSSVLLSVIVAVAAFA